jgi:transcriptional regulator with XRE-family HTH domain
VRIFVVNIGSFRGILEGPNRDGGTVQQLKAWRTRRFLTQKGLAEKAGVPYQTIQRWESGQSFPRPSHLQQLCSALGVTPDELLTPEELAGNARAA